MKSKSRLGSAGVVRASALALAVSTLGACSGGRLVTTVEPPPPKDSGIVPTVDADPTNPMFCGRGADVLSVTPPPGFCVKHYAQVGEPRAIAFAENGDLFVASPSRPTAGGANGGEGAIVVLTDDDRDGIGEEHMFIPGVEDVHGLAVGGGFLYYTTAATVWRTPYATHRLPGEPVPMGRPVSLGLPARFAGGGRWTHGVARSQGGQLLASRGEYGTCKASQGGEISSVGPTGALTTLASGFRNPMYLNCHFKDEVCAAMELGDDLHSGAREKMLIIRPNTNYGFPCCYTKSDPEMSGALCDDITKEEASFRLEDTPFGFDWERGAWPAPFKDGLFVALHGSAYSSPQWKGAAIVYAATSATTHAPNQDWQPFLQGFGPDGSVLERPSDVKFAPDGRLFFADDHSGRIFWVAPTTLAVPN
jgi:glucose/arabinose dehydrogenase